MTTLSHPFFRVNGHPDIVLESQRLSAVTHPVTDADLDLLFSALCRDFSFFEETRVQLLPHYFDPGAEVHYLLLWESLCAAATRGPPTHDTVDLACRRLLTERQGMLPPGFDDMLGNLVAYCFSERVLATSEVATAASVLDRLLEERTIVQPLKRFLAQGINGAYPENLSSFLDEVIAHRDRMGLSCARDKANGESLAEMAALVAAGVDHRPILVQNMVVGLEPMVISGNYGLGKSLLMTELAASMAMGTAVFGYTGHNTNGFNVPEPVRVGFFSTESGRANLYRNIEKILNHRRQLPCYAQIAGELHARAAENLRLNVNWLPDLGDKASIRKLCSVIRRHRLQYVILDPGTTALGSLSEKLKSDGDVYLALGYATEAIRNAGAGWMLVNQNASPRANKQKHDDPPDYELSSWPALSRFARGLWAVKPGAAFDPANRTLTLLIGTRLKNYPGSGTWRVTITEGHQLERWDVSCEPWQEVIRDRTVNRVRSGRSVKALAVLTMLQRVFPNSLSTSQLWREGDYKVDGVGRTNIRGILNELTGQRAITSDGNLHRATNGPCAVDQLSGGPTAPAR